VNRQTREQIVDDMVDAYVAWRQACLEVQDAHRLWGSGHGPGAAEAFERCAAALDEEARAADWYAELTRRTAAVLGAGGFAARAASMPGQQTPSA
jgi:hypothetical protein